MTIAHEPRAGRSTGTRLQRPIPSGGQVTHTTEDLIRIVEHEYKSTSKGSLAEKFQRRAGKLHAAQYRQARKVAQLVRGWASGGHGFVIPEKKPDGILRFLWENWNSLKVFTERKPQNGIGKHERIKQVDALHKRLMWMLWLDVKQCVTGAMLKKMSNSNNSLALGNYEKAPLRTTRASVRHTLTASLVVLLR